jgi:hypothetical protein
MNLLNIEIKICRGDTIKDASEVYPLQAQTLLEVIQNLDILKGKRTEVIFMCKFESLVL